MELQPQKYNNVSGISTLVTVSTPSPNLLICRQLLISIPGYHRLLRILRHHWSLLEDLFRLLFPTHHH